MAERYPALALAAAVNFAGCAHLTPAGGGPGGAAGGNLITAEMIEQSGSRTAWDVLRRHATYLKLGEDRRGQPSSMSRRGQASFLVPDAPLVLVDDVKMADFRVLSQIHAEEIATIRILNSIDGTTFYGPTAVGGVIEIRTKGGGKERGATRR